MKCGYVALIGRPNVGKSTLMNHMLGQKISITSRKPQTTRHRILGILNNDDYQIVFSDLPGVITPHYKLQEKMMKFIDSAMKDADIFLYMVEVGEKKYNEQIVEQIKKSNVPNFVIINKIDLSKQDTVELQIKHWESVFNKSTAIPVSALLNFNTEKVLNTIVELLPENPKPKPVKDCFEGLNRGIFALNQGLDKIIFKPVAKAYRVLPAPVRTGTSNVLVNLSSLITIPNNVLQGEFKTAGVNTGRFLINTTVGILGIFNVAKKMGFSEYEKEDYGQTFGVWGMGSGCYLVLPVLGPSTIRDTAGSFMNVLGGDPYYNVSIHGNNEYLDKSDYIATKVLTGIDFRAKNIESLENLEKNSMDFYASVKSLYLQDRQRKIANTKPSATIEILYEGDWEELESQ